MKTIELPVHDIELSIDDKNPGGGSITCSPNLYETCCYCGNKGCCYECDGSTAGGGGSGNEDSPPHSRLPYNGAVDGILSMILAHAVSGIDIESPAYVEGIKTALQAAAENI